jgi:S-adenosylhomocysteine hydrolase
VVKLVRGIDQIDLFMSVTGYVKIITLDHITGYCKIITLEPMQKMKNKPSLTASATSPTCAGARVLFSECILSCALQASLAGFQVAKLVRVMDQIDIFESSTGYFNIVTLERMNKVEDDALIGSFVHFDCEEATTGLHRLKEMVARGELLCSAIHSLPGGILRATVLGIGD